MLLIGRVFSKWEMLLVILLFGIKVNSNCRNFCLTTKRSGFCSAYMQSRIVKAVWLTTNNRLIKIIRILMRVDILKKYNKLNCHKKIGIKKPNIKSCHLMSAHTPVQIAVMSSHCFMASIWPHVLKNRKCNVTKRKMVEKIKI